MRVEIPLPERFEFQTEIRLLVSHMNMGHHLANEAVVSLLNEARTRFLIEKQIKEGDMGPGLVSVNADLALCYISEAFYGESLRVEVSAQDLHRCGFDLVYRLTEQASGRLVATAKTAHLVIDRERRKAVAIPEPVRLALLET